MSQNTETIVHVDADGEKCPMCNYRTSNAYRLECELERIAVCGDCFTTWLHEEGIEVVYPGGNDGE